MSIDFSNGEGQTNAPAAAAAATTTPEADAQGNAPTGSGQPDQGGFEYNGKVLSKEDVLKKLEHADSFIEQLKQEREQDRAWREQVEAKLANAGKVDSVLEALQGKAKEPKESSEVNPSTAPSLDPNELAAQIQKQVLEGLSQTKLEETRTNNWKTVTKTLTESYGEQVNAKVQEIAAAHDLSLEEAKELAHSRPKVFLNLFGIQGSKAEAGVAGSRYNTTRQVIQPKPKSNAGADWAKASKTSDQVSAYQARLQELLNR